ncbi:unnamed protein product [Rhizoctonia solani]|uniref:Bromo domain-containing protein n=1 Tax=Rhizoctonia solani TaxID=456999 RepID=A0A8H3CFB6_9AGAM|nr:unnamed protein product [Rhizoctonia solani]
MKATGRGARERKAVTYNDGMTDEQWVMAMEEAEDADEFYDMSARRSRATSRLNRDGASGSVTPAPEERNKRGKKAKGKGRADDLSGKRKRGKAQSPEPSSEEEDDESRAQQKRRRTQNPNAGAPPVPPAMRERMRAAFQACHQAIQGLYDPDGRQRCDLFKELPDKKDGSVTPAPEERNKRGKKAKGKGRADDLSGKRKRGKVQSPEPSSEDEEDDSRSAQKRRRTQGAGAAAPQISQAMRDRMKAAFQVCHQTIQGLQDEKGRQRCELFKELPNRKEYPDYYSYIQQPIAMCHMRKRASGTYYKSVTQYRDDWRLMFNNARTYNTEDSWVYQDANAMQAVFEEVFLRETAGTDMPGAEPLPSANPINPGNTSPLSAADDDEPAPRPLDDDEPAPRPPGQKPSRRASASDEEYLSGTDDD